MKLVPYDFEEMKFYKKTANYKILSEFAASELNCVKVEDYIHKNGDSCATSLRNSAKRFGMDNIVVIRKGETVILMKKSWLDKKRVSP